LRYSGRVNPGTSGLERGLAVLEALAGAEAASRGGLGVVRLAELVGSDKSQTSRTLVTLAGHGLVERDPDTLSYRIGWQVFALAARAGEPRLLTAAPRLLRGLVGDLGESAHLSVRQGASVLTLLSESPVSAIHAPGAVGALTPLANSSAGRALAFDLEPEELHALGLDGDAERIAAARALGYAIVREEFEPGLVAAAAPVRDGAGRVVAAVNVSAPAFRFAGRLEEAAAAVVAAAAELSAELGAPRRSAA
jgi:IclR family KDG regulon transcriptional repressor